MKFFGEKVYILVGCNRTFFYFKLCGLQVNKAIILILIYKIICLKHCVPKFHHFFATNTFEDWPHLIKVKKKIRATKIS